MSRAKTETMWLAWHEPSEQYLPWLWACTKKNLRDSIDRQQEFPQEYKCVRVKIAEIKPKRKAKP